MSRSPVRIAVVLAVVAAIALLLRGRAPDRGAERDPALAAADTPREVDDGSEVELGAAPTPDGAGARDPGLDAEPTRSAEADPSAGPTPPAWIEDAATATGARHSDGRGVRLEPAPADRRGFGGTVALRRGVLAVGTPGLRVHVFEQAAGEWRERARLAAPAGCAGFGGALWLETDALFVAAPESGELCVYRRRGGQWRLEERRAIDDVDRARLQPPQATAPPGVEARALAFGGGRCIAGDPGSDLAARDAGALLRFVREGERWRVERALVAPGASAGDRLGAAVATDGATVAAGAPGGGYAVVWALAPAMPRRAGR